jgi:hypothetical protein
MPPEPNTLVGLPAVFTEHGHEHYLSHFTHPLGEWWIYSYRAPTREETLCGGPTDTPRLYPLLAHQGAPLDSMSTEALEWLHACQIAARRLTPLPSRRATPVAA